jgi:TolA-binding protein
MRSSVFSIPVLLFLLSACGSNEVADTSSVAAETVAVVANAYAAAEDALKSGKGAQEVSTLMMDNFNAVSDPNTGKLNMQASKDFAKLARELADKFPGDTMTAMPFYRSAEVVRAMNDPKRAAAIYQDVYDRYPSFSKAPEALFMLAFTYDEDLKDLESAKTTYMKFLKNHPKHSFADDTEMLLKNLGKSDEDILKELEAKTKE